MTLSQRLLDLGISLPRATVPLGSYVPARRAGDLLHLSGHLAKRDGTVVTGRVGAEIDVEAARLLARQVALDLVAKRRLPVPVIEFTLADIVRSGICAMWARAFEEAKV